MRNAPGEHPSAEERNTASEGEPIVSEDAQPGNNTIV